MHGLLKKWTDTFNFALNSMMVASSWSLIKKIKK